MKGWVLLIVIYLGLVWMFEPAWNTKAAINESWSPTEAIILIDCKEVICPSYVEKKLKTKQKTIKATIFGYNSLPEQTDSTPFITADGSFVGPGIIANNCLPFNSRVQIGSKIFTVKDRMAPRYGCNYFDIWFQDLKTAQEWGVKILEIIIL